VLSDELRLEGVCKDRMKETEAMNENELERNMLAVILEYAIYH